MNKKQWKEIFLILVVATLIDLFVPDPIPMIDEILLIAGSLYSFRKLR